MKPKKKTRKKRSYRLKGKPVPSDFRIGEEGEEDRFFPTEEDMENQIIDIDEMEDFKYQPDESDDSEW